MKIYLATDHAGFELKNEVKKYLITEGYQVVDLGAEVFNEKDDYPKYISLAAKAVSKEQDSRAVVFGGSGQGEAMVANREKGVRATTYYSPNLEIISLSREHNNANILSIGARFINEEQAKQAVKLWLETEFSSEERHIRRINQF
ncbi:MAG: ribose-5-phosphate isomerase [Candidatus Harrisonbacteria bacterium CG10_big_fil_rev_8_21_14_0_10_38_8]|uniref:Ribose-5-phosphate isomerase n=1 Tax=Candidatus Harrisonbacteria bacterium CG10_big_fil_rev_8_21_14_0_10_38_8 TaxID=1974582 RepID=A0A2M6WJN1_9BACT|nr:MAG: ribose-5-phosphate isomerase [Candidatus Harrisonbacteria bacterium CG10_big_fil_rev_8_21_14_0_10_38_8]